MVIPRSRGIARSELESLRSLRKMMERRQLHARLAEAQGDRPICEIARLTDTNHETTRRYLRGISDPVPGFLVSFCEATETSMEWLMRGVGPSSTADAQAEILRGCAIDALLAEVIGRLSSGPNGAEPKLGRSAARQLTEQLQTWLSPNGNKRVPLDRNRQS